MVTLSGCALGGFRSNVVSAGHLATIDDDEAMRDSLGGLMEAAGLAAQCLGSAGEFLESDLHTRAAYLIVDIRMPKMSGL